MLYPHWVHFLFDIAESAREDLFDLLPSRLAYSLLSPIGEVSPRLSLETRPDPPVMGRVHWPKALSYCLPLLLWGRCFALSEMTDERPWETMQFLQISQQEGLSQSAVNGVIQDGLGFVWLATQEGLCRFDGYGFETFSHDPADVHGISNNNIAQMLEGEGGYLWLASRFGIDRFDPRTTTSSSWRFDNTQGQDINEVSTLFRDDRSGLWVGADRELLHFDGTTFLRFFHDPEDPNSLDGSLVRAIARAPDGHLWVATSNKVQLFDPAAGTFRERLDKTSIGVKEIFTLFCDSRGTLWLGTDDGVFSTDKQAQTWRRVPGLSAAGNKRINVFFKDSRGNLWAGTDSGIHVYHNNGFLPLRPKNLAPSVQNAVITGIMEDRGGCLWFSTFGKGLLRANPYVPTFSNITHDPDREGSIPSNIITGILHDREGRLWVCTLDQGLNLREAEGQPFLVFREGDGSGFGDRGAFDARQDEAGTVWVGTPSGLFRYLGDHAFEEVGDLVDISKILPVGDGIWAATYSQGLFLIDRDTGRRRALFTTEQGLADDMVMALAQAVDGTLWIGTAKGLHHLSDGKMQAHNQEGVGDQMITALFQDSRGVIWVGTNGRGCSAFDGGDLVTYTHEEGLPNDFVMGFLEDASRHIWISTTKGLARLDRGTGTLRVFDKSDGLAGEEFVSGASFKGPEGRLYMGTTAGLVTFLPSRFKPGANPPAAELTVLRLSNLPTSTTAYDVRSPLAQSIGYTQSLQLSHEQKMLTLEFALLDYRNPKKNRYMYKLQGFDGDWIRTTSDRRHATYTNLDPGHYTFLLKAAGPDGIWTPRHRKLHVEIKPHPLFSLPAKILYGLAAALILFGYVRLQRIAVDRAEQLARRDRALARQERQHTVRLEKEVAERSEELVAAQRKLITQEKLASLGTLAAGVAHEIRNPLNFINNFSHVIRDFIEELGENLRSLEDGPGKRESIELLDDMTESANGIIRHGRRAEGIVENMLGFAQGRKAALAPGELNILVREYVNLSFHSDLNTDPKGRPELHFRLDNRAGMVLMDEQSMSRVIINLVNNAIEATRARAAEEADYRGEIVVRSGRNLSNVWVKVRDNGVGIPADDLDQIFRPFFTTKNEGQNNVGLGLSLSYDIVVGQHGGHLRVDSKMNDTEFTVEIPINP